MANPRAVSGLLPRLETVSVAFQQAEAGPGPDGAQGLSGTVGRARSRPLDPGRPSRPGSLLQVSRLLLGGGAADPCILGGWVPATPWIL